MEPLAVLVAEVEHSSGIPAAAVGILTMAAFVLLLVVTLAFRSVGSRNRQR